MVVRLSLVVCTTFLFVSAPALANVIYMYDGNAFNEFVDSTPPAGSYSTEDRISIRLEFAQPLAPNLVLQELHSIVLSFSASDGKSTLSGLEKTGGVSLATNSAGEIVAWSLFFTSERMGAVGDQATQISSENFLSFFVQDDAKLLECTSSSFPGTCSQALFDEGKVFGQPGSWAIVPEPSTAALLAAGLLSLAASRRLFRLGA